MAWHDSAEEATAVLPALSRHRSHPKAARQLLAGDSETPQDNQPCESIFSNGTSAPCRMSPGFFIFK
jgi:hypothetical protein